MIAIGEIPFETIVAAWDLDNAGHITVTPTVEVTDQSSVMEAIRNADLVIAITSP